MKKAEKTLLVAEYDAELERQTAEGSTASHAKKADFSVRDYLLTHGVENADDVRCRAADKYDWQVRRDRKLLNGETKCGCSALRYGKTAADVACEPDKILPTVHYVAYCAESAKLKKDGAKQEVLFRVFTRVEFLTMLTDTGRKGLESSLRVHQTKSGTWQLEIQPWATKQTAARLGKYEDWVKAHGIPTLEEFRKGLRG